MARRRSKSSRRRRKIERGKAIYVLPNLFTSANIFLGFYGMVAAMGGRFYEACLTILGSLVFDYLDGKVARATQTQSRFGVEYDSLADLVAFGVAPAVLVFLWGLKPFGRLGWLAAFLFVTCGALRLARFNVQTEKVGTKHFVGLPIPAAASFVATGILMMEELGSPGPVDLWPVVAAIFMLSFLMVSNIHYLSFKDIGLARLKSFNWLVAGILCIILVAMQPAIMGFVLMLLYAALGPWGAHLMAKRREAEAQEDQPLSEKVTSA